MSAARKPDRRHSATTPCPVCGGYEGAHRGQGERCFGFISGEWVHCSREEHAGQAKYHDGSQTYAHRAEGACPCGHEHRPAPSKPATTGPRAKITATYDYRDLAGTLIFQAVRMTPKSFRQRRPDPSAKGGWSWNLTGTKPLLYRLPELATADPSAVVYVVEGEKDADRLAKFGIVTTCNPMGAGKWRGHYSAHLKGRDVVILPDNDKPGREHAEAVARSVAPVARSVKVLKLPDLAEHGDVSDWLDRGRTLADLKALAESAPLWRPAEAPPTLRVVGGAEDPPEAASRPAPPAGAPTFSNYRTTHRTIEGEGGKPKEEATRHALRVAELDDQLKALAGEWPRRVKETLFWESKDHTPVLLKSSSQLFAYIDTLAQVDWTKGAKFIPQERFFEHKRMTAEAYEAVETLPHWPRIPGIFYMHRAIPKATGRLGELVDFFRPATEEDRELILALILTLFWGGSPGCRPAFLVTGPDQDPHQGRGIGKTRLAQILSQELVGGFVDVSPTDEIAAVKTRLLSDGGSQARVAMLDNIKTLRFSWADLEGLITSSTISGKALYVGEGRRPNTLVWIMTLNGASLSKDMAQRVIPIKLARPVNAPDWEQRVREFIRTHRWEIIAEIGETLDSEPGPLVADSRWGAWERDILSKLCRAEKCKETITKRQSTIDDDNEESDLVAERFRQEIKRCRQDPEAGHLFIPSQTASRWVNRATNRNMPTNQASSHLRGLGIPELRKPASTKQRGWVWLGPEADPQSARIEVKDPEDNPGPPFGGDGERWER